MDYINNVITRYQQCIGKYDKQIWEQAVEREARKKLVTDEAPRKTAKVNPDLIDVDLFRTSPFSKSKPQQSWITACRKALPRTILFPLYSKWWIRTTSGEIYCLLLFLYILKLTVLTIAYIHNGYSFFSESISISHILSPCIMMYLLVVIHVQVVSTYESSSQYGRLRAFNAATAADLKKRQQLLRNSPKKSDGRPGASDRAGLGGSVRLGSGGLLRVGHDRSADAESTGSLDTGIDLDVNRDTMNKKVSNSGSTAQQCRQTHGARHKSVTIAENCATHRSGGGVSSASSRKSGGRVRCASSSSCKRGNSLKVPVNVSAGNISTEECGSEAERFDLDLQPIDRSDSTRDWVSRHSTSQQISDDDNLRMRRRDVETCSERGGLRDDAAYNEIKKSAANNYNTLPRRLHTYNPSFPLNELRDNGDNVINLRDSVIDIRDRSSFSPTFNELQISFSPVINIERSGASSESELMDELLVMDKSADSVFSCSVDCRRRASTSQDSSSNMVPNERKQRQSLTHQSRGFNEFDESDNGDLNNSSRHTSDSAKRNLSEEPRMKQVLEDVINSNSSASNSCESNIQTSEGEDERGATGGQQRMKPKLSSRNSAVSGKYQEVRFRSDKLKGRGVEWNEGGQTDDDDVVVVDDEDDDTCNGAVNTDNGSSASDDASCTCSSSDLSARDVCGEDERNVSVLNTSQGIHASSILNSLASANDRVSCMIWEADGIHKVNLSVLDIGFTIIQKIDSLPESCHYLCVGVLFSVIVMLTPLAYRTYHGRLDLSQPLSYSNLTNLYTVAQLVVGDSWCESVIVLSGLVQRFFLSLILFFLLSVAERTFKQRLLYAKNFCYLTSSRRAKKYDLPHFRLNKVRNIKTWLSLRSFLKKRGPQRSVECIVSAAFLLTIILLSIICLEMLQEYDSFLDYLGNWELAVWCLLLGTYLLRFMTLGTKINQKYRNFSLLITEQMNLYLHMEQKPHKKDELMVANSVLRLAEELLKELDAPFKISGLSANPLLYNLTKVVVLSAFSAVLTDLLGFKLKLYKIKLKS